jgi:Leucine-rich repeat (LRR) protein
LDVGARQVPDLAKLANLPKLKNLSIIAQSAIDLSPVGRLTDLRKLSILHLQELAISGDGFFTLSQVTGINTIGNLKALKKLSLAGCGKTGINANSPLQI